jgi:glycosyltransferase involved in cell wall biosynthesis
MTNSPPILIPAYEPAESLPMLVSDLTGRGYSVVVVDDGSGPGSADIFEALTANPSVALLRHAVNLGKGAALRTGINYILTHDRDAMGLVTADADGQHLAPDIDRVAEELSRAPDHLVLGVRTFHRDVPLRSRLGNLLTRNLVRTVIGRRMTDTQTGLRGIPRALARDLLRLPAAGYEFELDMLVLGKHLSIPVKEVPIATVYLNGNDSSHFNPVRDSMKIYFVLFRFALLSLATALVDNVVFIVAFAMAGKIGLAQIVGRLVAMLFNYGMARRAVFLSRAPHHQTLPRYALLVLVNGFVSYALLTFLHTRFGMDVITSKISAELLLFCANFALQRDFVFTRKREPEAQATDWDSYYRSTFPAARWTRQYTTSALRRILSTFAVSERPVSIIEFGGANSCFARALTEAMPTERYYAADLNRYGLSMLTGRKDLPDSIVPVHADVLNPNADLPQADIVMSVGLIEHFSPAATRQAIENHFRFCKADGLVILSYPTPTLLYRIARWLAESVHAWKFPDERPLKRPEVHQVASEYGILLEDRILWPLIFTQRLMAFRKLGGGGQVST